MHVLDELCAYLQFDSDSQVTFFTKFRFEFYLAYGLCFPFLFRCKFDFSVGYMRASIQNSTFPTTTMKALLFLALSVLSIVIFVLPDLPFVQHKILEGHWIAAFATVSDVRVRDDAREASSVAKKHCTTFIEYSYHYNDKEYTDIDIEKNDEVYPAGDSLSHIQQYKLSRYPLGSQLSIKINVDEPTQSYVVAFHTQQLPGVTIGIVLGALFLYMAFRQWKRAGLTSR